MDSDCCPDQLLHVVGPAMDRHRRMDRTLYCLVAAMTIGAGFLHLCQPGRSSGRSSATPLTAASASWTGVDVDSAVRPDGRSGSDAHYHVDRHGRVAATDTWLRQSVSSPQGRIRIALQAGNAGQAATPRQWDATLTLVNDLLKRYQITVDQVVFSDNVRRPPTPEPTAGESRPRPATSESRP